jgi:L-threonylcarbamoyladenylate synthase
MSVPAAAEARLLAGELALIPTDTVYGIACAVAVPDACRRLYALKDRPPEQPTAVIFGSVAAVEAAIPELAGAPVALLDRVMPGPVTLIVPNPAGRFPHVCGASPDMIGIRVPVLPDDVAYLANGVRGLVATSANLRGGPDPAALDEVPPPIRQAAGFEVDGGRLRGAPSAVVDVTGPEPMIVRDSPDSAQLLRLLAG